MRKVREQCIASVATIVPLAMPKQTIDGLAAIVQAQLKLDPYSSALFLLCGRRCDHIKGLLWEGDGFPLLYNLLKLPSQPHSG